MGAIGLLKGLREEGDAARGLAARHRKPPVHPPEIREPRRPKPLAPHRRRAKRFGRLANIVLLEPGLGQRTADLDLLVPVQARLTQRSDKKGRGFHAGSPFERPRCLTVEIGRWHGAQYSRYTGEVDTCLASAIRDSRFAVRFKAEGPDGEPANGQTANRESVTSGRTDT